MLSDSQQPFNQISLDMGHSYSFFDITWEVDKNLILSYKHDWMFYLTKLLQMSALLIFALCSPLLQMGSLSETLEHQKYLTILLSRLLCVLH